MRNRTEASSAAGQRATAGTFKCSGCGYVLDVEASRPLPLCPSCGCGQWAVTSFAQIGGHPDRIEP